MLLRAAFFGCILLVNPCTGWGANPLSIEIKPVLLIRQGPVVVDVVVRYDGELLANVYSPISDISIMVENAPKRTRTTSWRISSGAPKTAQVQSVDRGWSVTKRFNLNEANVVLQHENLSTTIICELHEAKRSYVCGREDVKHGNLLASVSKKYDLTLKSVSEAELAIIAGDISRKSKSIDQDSDEFRNLCGSVLFCRQRSLCSTLFTLLEQSNDVDIARDLVETIYECNDDTASANKQIVSYLSGKNPSGTRSIFDFWQREDSQHKGIEQTKQNQKSGALSELDREFLNENATKNRSRRHEDMRLTEAELRIVANIGNVWARLLFYSFYPDQCSSSWSRRLVEDLNKEIAGPNEAELRRLREDLDSDSFSKREAATRRLIAYGDVVKRHLFTSLNSGPSAEAESRMRHILAEMEKCEPPKLIRDAISKLAMCEHPTRKRILNVLTVETAPTHIRETAKSLLKLAQP